MGGSDKPDAGGKGPAAEGKPGKKPSDHFDPFVIQEIFPDASAIFSSSFSSLEEVKQTACVVMDTNALLLPYGIGKEGLEEIRATYQRLADEQRLIIPGQVAREFGRNRIEKLKQLHNQLTKKMQFGVSPSASLFRPLEK